MTVGEALSQGAALLNQALAAGEEAPSSRTALVSPALDAALLLGDILGMDRAGLILADRRPVSPEVLAAYQRSLKRRYAGESVAYIRGRKEFRGLDFSVTAGVLVPRPDTETLVEAALARLDSRFPAGPLCLLDLCTGSGAVAISLKYERPVLAVYASDISEAALQVARANALRLLPAESAPGSRPGVLFVRGDLFAALEDLPAPERVFDLITANPPYIPSALIGSLAPEVQREPRIALDGGRDGMDLIRRIIGEAPGYLRPGGDILLEADPSQMQNIGDLLASRGYKDIQLYMDLAGNRRVIGGRFGN
ncbi:MAG: peptide chain release factor N(5)-glutamine methyltransferase [Spirochaetaceae bacterium]|jgi:release factor glutamine methyltransferase|nr:peptide chain release factor N(5)-glutamine methyltransferase [Spirochaetaceae bacterium]